MTRIRQTWKRTNDSEYDNVLTLRLLVVAEMARHAAWTYDRFSLYRSVNLISFARRSGTWWHQYVEHGDKLLIVSMTTSWHYVILFLLKLHDTLYRHTTDRSGTEWQWFETIEICGSDIEWCIKKIVEITHHFAVLMINTCSWCPRRFVHAKSSKMSKDHYSSPRKKNDYEWREKCRTDLTWFALLVNFKKYVDIRSGSLKKRIHVARLTCQTYDVIFSIEISNFWSCESNFSSTFEYRTLIRYWSSKLQHHKEVCFCKRERF